jgi:predicted phage baseplate assembly protein
VVEIDNDGRAHLRFGNGELGRAPSANSKFTASYRVGNGPRGNVGAEAIRSLVFRKQRMSGVNLLVRNPLPAQGGIEAEPVAEVKLFAPVTFLRELQRAVTADDYTRLAERGAGAKLQRAAAAPLRWTGSWYEAQVAVDPFGSEELDPELGEEVAGYLYRYRRIGHDLRVLPASYVPLQIGLNVCVLPHHLRAHIKTALLDLFSNRELANGQRGFFHPDNLSFGEGIYLSKLVAVAQAVPGVESVQVSVLQRLYEGKNQEIENGILPLGPLEVGRLDNDPSFPEHGRLQLNLRGGR